MKRITFLILIAIAFWSCQDEINVFVTKEPGSIAGRVLPLNVEAFVELYQGKLIKNVHVDENGYFLFLDVVPGTYIVKAKADNFGTTIRSNVHITDGEGYDIGTIELSQYPYPLQYAEPFNGAGDVYNFFHRARIRLNFSKEMDNSSVEAAFHIEPDVEDLTFLHPKRGSGYQIEGIFEFGTEYTFTLDTTATSHWGEVLEFPYSSTFTTENFKVTQFWPSYAYPNESYSRIYFSFNSLLGAVSFEDYLTVDPETDVQITYYYGGRGYQVLVEPSLSWRPDTTYTFTISGDLPEIEGATLGADTSLSLWIPPLQVVNTIPYSNQHFVPIGSTVRVRMNNLLDEGSIQNSVTLSPSVNFQVSTLVSFGSTTFTLAPDSLIANTQYTVTIDTTLKDFYGGNIKEPYSFSFVTD